MAGRRTNLALLLLLPLALATGALAFALGSGWTRWAVVAHGAIAFAIVILVPWKSVIARRGLHRRRPGSWASVVFAGLVAVALGAGIGHSTGLLRTLGSGVTAMQVHVGAALASIPFGLWHAVARRVRPRPTDLSRRTALRSAGLAAASLAVYGGVAGVVRMAGLPGRSRRVTGSFERGSLRPAEMPVTQWLSDRIPLLDPDAWRLSVRLRGEAFATRSLGELQAMAESVHAVIDCTGGWFAEQEWSAVRLDRLLPVDVEARSIRAISATGYSRLYPSQDASRLWIAVGAGGEPLSAGHGFPVRMVAPGRRGFWWVKWVVAIDATDTPWWWQPPFPLQ